MPVSYSNVVTTTDILQIADLILKDERIIINKITFLRILELERRDFDSLEQSINRNNMALLEFFTQGLTFWQSIQSNNATWEKLINLLRENRFNMAAERLQDALNQKIVPSITHAVEINDQPATQPCLNNGHNNSNRAIRNNMYNNIQRFPSVCVELKNKWTLIYTGILIISIGIAVTVIYIAESMQSPQPIPEAVMQVELRNSSNFENQTVFENMIDKDYEAEELPNTTTKSKTMNPGIHMSMDDPNSLSNNYCNIPIVSLTVIPNGKKKNETLIINTKCPNHVNGLEIVEAFNQQQFLQLLKHFGNITNNLGFVGPNVCSSMNSEDEWKPPRFRIPIKAERLSFKNMIECPELFSFLVKAVVFTTDQLTIVMENSVLLDGTLKSLEELICHEGNVRKFTCKGEQRYCNSDNLNEIKCRSGFQMNIVENASSQP